MANSSTQKLPRLSQEAHIRVKDTIEAEREMGDRQVASDLEVLLDWHDKFHGIDAGV